MVTTRLIEFLFEHWLELILIAFVFRSRKEILQAIRGGNGKAQMHEIAQFGLIVLLFWCVWIEGTRRDLERHVFSDAFFGQLLLAVFLIAGLKVIPTFNKVNPKPPDQPN